LGQLRADLPTAMLAVNVTAIGAVQVLRERAFVLPRDMGLDCFYDVERLAVLSPFRTVIERPAGDLGTLGTQMLRAGLYQIKYGPCFRYTQR
jgi:LacI family transcriptional regulator